MTLGRVDPVVLRRHLAALREAMAGLRKHTGHTTQELAANTDLRWMIERGLQLCAQNVLDIATHITSAAGLDSADYASAIDRLAELQVVSIDFAGRLRGIAGFRNVLVHGYLRVDLEIVQTILSARLPELEQFARDVERWLEKG